MNADTLADELDESRKESYTSENLVGKAATMLRQQQAEINALKKEAALQRLSDFTQEAEALKAHPVKELHLSLQKSKQTGELLAVTYTDDEHRIVEVLWQRPPELTDEKILIVWTSSNFVRYTETGHIDEIFFNKFAKAILKKASEK